MNTETFLKEIQNQEARILYNFQKFPNHFEHIGEYHHQMLMLAKAIQQHLNEANNSKKTDEEISSLLQLSKSGIRASCEVTTTRIYIQKSSGWEKFCPYIISEEDRNASVKIYDYLLLFVISHDKMFIPMQLERTSPTPEKLQFILRNYFSSQTKHAQKEQSEGQKQNHLFGSRG